MQVFPEATRSSLGPQAKSLLETAYTGRAFARESQGDIDGMARDFEMAIALAPPGRARILRFRCATFLSADGRNDRALAMAEPLVNDAALDGPTTFELAGLYAAAADPAKMTPETTNKKEQTALADRHIAHAVSLLERAYKAHYFADPINRKKLSGAPFVPTLSGNADFQRLLAAVGRNPAGPEPPKAK